MEKNIEYKTHKIANYFKNNRITWEQFYESERKIISRLGLTRNSTILDIGCGCGGLSFALLDQFDVKNYTGVEINPFAAESAQTMNPKAHILCGDIIKLSEKKLIEKQFDVVFSLSCIDWNVQFDEMLSAAWRFVKPEGGLVATFRLTIDEGCKDINRSYQYINFDGILEGECANYVVLNVNEILQQLCDLNPLKISAYGYWGAPSGTAVTPYETLCFSAFSFIKRKTNDNSPVSFDLDFPKGIYDILDEPFNG